jgi:dihydrofolate reductase
MPPCPIDLCPIDLCPIDLCPGAHDVRIVATDSEESAMGTIGVHEFMTLDGLIDAPTWTADYGFDPKMGETLAAITGSAEAILLGRTTFEMFAPAWSTRTADDDPGAPFFNDTTKYVVSSTLTDPESVWRNSTALGAYDADKLRELKDRTDGGIYVSGSGTLVRALLADGLVDDLHLFVYPLSLGSGLRLFPEGAPTRLALKESTTYDNGVLHLNYGPAS